MIVLQFFYFYGIGAKKRLICVRKTNWYSLQNKNRDTQMKIVLFY